MNNPYSVLGVDPYADEQTIKRAYRQLSKTYHPDNNINNPNKKQAEEKFKDIQEAYEQIMSERTGNFGGGYRGTSSGNTYGPGSSRYYSGNSQSTGGNSGYSSSYSNSSNNGYNNNNNYSNSNYNNNNYNNQTNNNSDYNSRSSRNTNYSDNYYTGAGYNGRAYSNNGNRNSNYSGTNQGYYQNGQNQNNNYGYSNGYTYSQNNGAYNGGFQNNGYQNQNNGFQNGSGAGWQNTGSRNYWDGVRATAGEEEEAEALNKIADMINKGMFNDALFELTGVRNRSALWYYYSAVSNLALGNNLTARSHAQMAYDMDPAKREYFDLYTGIDQGTLKYRGQNQVYANNGSRAKDNFGKILPCICGIMMFSSGEFCRYAWILCL